MPGMQEFPINVGFMQDLPEDLQANVTDLLTEFNSAMIYMEHASDPGEERLHQEFHTILGLTDAMIAAGFSLSDFEHFKARQAGENPKLGEIVSAVMRMLISALTLASIRFGQHNPDAFLAGSGAHIEELMDRLTRELSGNEEED